MRQTCRLNIATIWVLRNGQFNQGYNRPIRLPIGGAKVTRLKYLSELLEKRELTRFHGTPFTSLFQGLL